MQLKADKKAQIQKALNVSQKAVDGAILDSQAALSKAIKKLEGKLISQASQLKTTPKGKLMGLKTNWLQSKKLHASAIKLFSETYTPTIKADVTIFNRLAAVILREFKATGLPTSYTNLDKDAMKVLKTNAYKQFAQFGDQAQQRVAQGLYDAVIGQSEFSELTTLFKGIMTGHKDVRGRSMATYAKQYASDSQMQFTRSVRKVKADSIGLEHFAYMGTDIADSRPFCIARRGEVFTREEVESWNDMDWKGKAPGDVWTNLGGYNCRCNLLGIRPDWVEDE